MPPQDGEENVLIICASRKILAELNVAMFWPLCAEVFCPPKQDDLSYLLRNMLFTMLYSTVLDAYLVQNAMRFLKIPSRSFSCFLGHIGFQKFQ